MRLPTRDELRQLVRDLRREFSEDRVGGLAAEISFFSLLSVFPLAVVLVAALGLLEPIAGASFAEDAEAEILTQLESVFARDSAIFETVSSLFDGTSAGALTFGVVIALYTSSRAFAALVSALDTAYDHHERRGWIATRLVGLALAFGTVLVGSGVLALIVVGPLFDWYSTLWTWIRWPIALAVLIAWVATIYHVGPNHRSPWRFELPGSVFTAVWCLIASFGLSVYLSQSASSNAVFGILGGAISLLLWFYVLSIGLLIGAELNSLLAHQQGVSTQRRSAREVTRQLRARRRVDSPRD